MQEEDLQALRKVATLEHPGLVNRALPEPASKALPCLSPRRWLLRSGD
jgi:hypothetical protein